MLLIVYSTFIFVVKCMERLQLDLTVDYYLDRSERPYFSSSVWFFFSFLFLLLFLLFSIIKKGRGGGRSLRHRSVARDTANGWTFGGFLNLQLSLKRKHECK